MLTESQDHQLLKEAISHHELLGGTRDVSVVVQDAHACESGDLHLEGDVLAQVWVSHGLLCGVDAMVSSAHERSSEALVPNLVNHTDL